MKKRTLRHDTTTTFRLPQAAIDALNAIRERDGIPNSEQMRRAVNAWIVAKLGNPPRIPVKTGGRS